MISAESEDRLSRKMIQEITRSVVTSEKNLQFGPSPVACSTRRPLLDRER